MASDVADVARYFRCHGCSARIYPVPLLTFARCIVQSFLDAWFLDVCKFVVRVAAHRNLDFVRFLGRAFKYNVLEPRERDRVFRTLQLPALQRSLDKVVVDIWPGVIFVAVSCAGSERRIYLD